MAEQFYLISDVVPDKNSTGGAIVLYRHFIERSDINFSIVDVPLVKNKLYRWFETSRFRSYAKAFFPYIENINQQFIEQLPKPLFVLTIAHDRKCYIAKKAASFWRVPLVTIFHDWFPASSGVHPSLRFFLDREFLRLYKSSSLALCVSKQMMLALGEHPNALILPPIPSSIKASPDQKSFSSLPNLFYSGFCGGAYKEMLNGFITASSGQVYSLFISGANSEELVNTSTNTKLLGFLDEKGYSYALDQADILLVFLNFDIRRKQHFSTHFPSKLIEYCGKKRMIAIWGPTYSTAVQWAKETGAAFFYEQENVEGFISELLKAYADNTHRGGLIANAERIYENEYAPEIIDSKLKIAINKLFSK